MDALGPSVPYQAYLSSIFPGISITVKPKADSLYTIVGAASVAAKVTRDAWIEGWMWEELSHEILERNGTNMQPDAVLPLDNPKVTPPLLKGSDQPVGSGYPSGTRTSCRSFHTTLTIYIDPNTKAWLKSAFEPTFGFPSFVRFSWATAKIMLETEGHKVQWLDEWSSLCSSSGDEHILLYSGMTINKPH